MPWIPGGVIPACPCGAPSDDQVRRTSGGETVRWFCLVCQTPVSHTPIGLIRSCTSREKAGAPLPDSWSPGPAGAGADVARGLPS